MGLTLFWLRMGKERTGREGLPVYRLVAANRLSGGGARATATLEANLLDSHDALLYSA
jgi:hypothetical protein